MLEIEARASGMSTLPMAMSVHASDGVVQSATQLVEASESLRSSAKFTTRASRCCVGELDGTCGDGDE